LHGFHRRVDVETMVNGDDFSWGLDMPFVSVEWQHDRTGRGVGN
jgi:hypothetical protein